MLDLYLKLKKVLNKGYVFHNELKYLKYLPIHQFSSTAASKPKFINALIAS